MRRSWLVLFSLASWTIWSCSSARDAASGRAPTATGGTQGGSFAPPATATPPEVELEENFRSPVVSGTHLWTANPETNRIALIDARSFEVRVFDGGHAPTYLAPLPATDSRTGALVLNSLGKDASIFEFSLGAAGLGGAPGGDVDAWRVNVQHGASAWTVGNAGRFAVAWSRFEEDLRGPLDGYQELTVVDLSATPRATKLSVGYRPSQVVINEDETRAYVVSKPGISVIELDGSAPRVLRELALPAPERGVSRDVSFTRDGRLAFVRLPDSSAILLVETETNERQTVQLPEIVTDLDLSPRGDLAVAVMRGPADGAGLGGAGGLGGGAHAPGSSLVALLDVATIFESPGAFRSVSVNELVGSTVIAEGGDHALLFTNAVASSQLVLLNLETEMQRAIDVTAPIQAAFVSHDGSHALSVMTPPPGSQRAGAFALIDLQDEGPPRIEGTRTVPRFVSLEGGRATLTTWGSLTQAAATHVARFPELFVDRIELTSEPLASGVLPDVGLAFVAQAHPEGRLTFVDLDTAEARTVTGFELASEVVD